MVKVMTLLVKAGSGLVFTFGVRAWTEMEIWCMHRLKLVSSEEKFRVRLKWWFRLRSYRIANTVFQWSMIMAESGY